MLEDDLKLYKSLKYELHLKRKAYNESVKGLKHSIKSLEDLITEQVLEAGRTVSMDNVVAEYVPTVVISIKNKKEEGE